MTVAHTDKEGDSPRPARSLRERLAFHGGLVLTVALMHYALYKPLAPAPLGRVGSVVELDATLASTYEDGLDRVQPALVMLGDSHQLFFSVTQRNSIEGVKRKGGDMILDELARHLDRQHGAHAHTYARFAAVGFKPFEQLAKLGLLLARGTYAPKVVVLSTRWEMFISATMLHNEIDASPMQRFPDAARAWLAELESPAVAASPAVLMAAHELLAPPAPPLTADIIDDRAGKWLAQHKLLERNRRLQWFFTYQYQKLEAPVQQALFGDIEQMGPQNSPLIPDARLRDFGVDSTRALIRLLRARNVKVLCYLAPHNPAGPFSDLQSWAPDVTRRVREAAVEEGCPILDLSNAVPGGPEYWGFAGGDRDPVHMRPRGIAETARVLYEEGERLGVWSALDSP
jgi:hypothetical protein